MKQLLLFTTLLVALATTTNAQESFAKGDLVGHAGIGVSTYFSGRQAFLPVMLSLEYGVHDSFLNGKAAIGVGGYIGYAAVREKNFNIRTSHTVLGARGSFYYEFAERLDTYVGIALGYERVSVGDTKGNVSYVAPNSGVFPSSYIGARYYFSPQLAAFAEFGYGISPLELGVAFKF
ncbi:MAG: hypothetical protein LBG30_03300 [Odoribacteraceae bacterium]|jgi:hypothetical protein|nr:hypothetical protein [Odoribacteraceae bacterium]